MYGPPLVLSHFAQTSTEIRDIESYIWQWENNIYISVFEAAL